MKNPINIEKELAPRLIKWHKKNKRDFPWRRTKEPYYILIAEILLQRTKAEQVKLVYEDFIKKFPTVHSLANTRVKKIEGTIKSLGLIKKGKMLKQLAKQIVEIHNGEIPKKQDDLLKLMLVGHYVANAVSCFAYGLNYPIIDWNIARVFSRITAYELKSTPHTDKKFISYVSDFIPKGQAKNFNLALLDFSAAVCAPKKTSCDTCPVNRMCAKKYPETKGEKP